jgi:CubicO group peptidase (beta-lactamase class C family)
MPDKGLERNHCSIKKLTSGSEWCQPHKSLRSGLRLSGIALLCGMLAVVTACSPAVKRSESAQGAYSGEKVAQSIQKIQPPAYWPTSGWRTAVPEEHGVDSAIIASMVEEFKGHNLHSFVLIRDGYLLAEGYNQATTADNRQPMYSVTKSVTSSITGMLIAEGLLTGVDQKLKEFFPEVQRDAAKANISLDQVLSMTSGLEWDNKGERSSNEMADSPNWLQYVLERPVTEQPGTAFKYNNGNAHLMSGVLQTALGVPMSLYAKSKLFEPLGITNMSWGLDPQGYSIGAWSLQLTTRDMAKFGLLYLHNGQWENKEIVPRSWVEASVQQRVAEKYADGTRGGYGYFWWLKPVTNTGNAMLDHDVFYAAGSGGQRIFIVPNLNLVMAVTGNNQKEDYMPESMLVTATSAVRSDQPLPTNTEAASKLAAAIQALKETVDKPE